MEDIRNWLASIFQTPENLDLESQLRELPLSRPRKDAMSIRNPAIHMLNGPILRTPLSDIFNMASYQEGPPFCANMEMMMLNCMEQYGYERGMRLCNGYVQDLEECKYHNFEGFRHKIMTNERKRQIAAGERKVPYEPAPPLNV